MKLFTALVGVSVAFGTLTMAAPARPPPPSSELINTTIAAIKSCIDCDCSKMPPGTCASTVSLDARDKATTNVTDTANVTTNDMINTLNVAALDVEAKEEKQSVKAKKGKKGKKGKMWDLCILFFNPLACDY